MKNFNIIIEISEYILLNGSNWDYAISDAPEEDFDTYSSSSHEYMGISKVSIVKKEEEDDTLFFCGFTYLDEQYLTEDDIKNLKEKFLNDQISRGDTIDWNEIWDYGYHIPEHWISAENKPMLIDYKSMNGLNLDVTETEGSICVKSFENLKDAIQGLNKIFKVISVEEARSQNIWPNFNGLDLNSWSG